MKQFSFCVDGEHTLQSCMEQFRTSCPEEYSAILIFVFTSRRKASEIWEMTETLQKAFPKAVIAGSTTSGEILNGELQLHSTILDFLVFERTKVMLQSYDFTKLHADEAGSVLLGRCQRMRGLKAVGLLGTMKVCNVKPFLAMLSKLPEDVEVFGGGSDTYDDEELGCVFTTATILKKGMLAICFTGDLHVKLAAHIGWKTLGLPMEITGMYGDNIVTELDHQPALAAYEKYLDISRNEEFVHDTIEFPVMLERNGHMLARSPGACTPDGALIFSADLQVGERVWLGYGDPNEIERQSAESQRQIAAFAPEAIAFFCCISRRIFLQNEVQADLSFYHHAGIPNAGFYTYGEVMRTKQQVELMNITMLAVGFREGEPKENRISLDVQAREQGKKTERSLIQRLAHFVSVTTRELEEANEKLARMAAQDRLTELNNRGEVETLLKSELDSPVSRVRPVSVIMLDLDKFKHINDTYGHGVGDDVLKFTANALRQNIRNGDAAGRWGGEEFLLLLPGTALEQAVGVAERIRQMLEASSVLPDGKSITASFGVAQYQPGEDYGAFYRRLDALLYQAKDGGRNRVEWELG